MLYLASGESSDERDDAFAEWMAASEENRRAFERANALWDGLADVDGIEDLLTEQETVAAFRPRSALSRRRLLIGGGIAASLFCAAGIGLLLARPAPAEEIQLATLTGEIETFTLSDGSRITLGGASRVTGRFTAKARQLELAAGNAYFDIARDEARPLTVNSGTVQVRVLGTRFDIKRRTDWTSVSVASGHVAVTGRAAPGRRDLLAGDKLVASVQAGLGEVQGFDAEQEASWRTGRLSFIDAPLSDIVADINQYSPRPVRLAADAPADMRLTLSFTTEQIDQMLAGLDAAYPVQVQTTDSGILISKDR